MPETSPIFNISNIVYLFSTLCDPDPHAGGDSTIQVELDIAFKLVKYMEQLVQEAMEVMPAEDELIIDHGSDVDMEDRDLTFDDNGLTMCDDAYDPDASDTPHTVQQLVSLERMREILAIYDKCQQKKSRLQAFNISAKQSSIDTRLFDTASLWKKMVRLGKRSRR